jgi:hypothetical protein
MGPWPRVDKNLSGRPPDGPGMSSCWETNAGVIPEASGRRALTTATHDER